MTDKTPLPTPLTFTPVPRKRMRRGGWSAERQREFIDLLAETGSVRAACRRMGVGEHHIYKLRNHPEAASFRKAWEAALDMGIARIEDIAMDRAISGVEQPVYFNGEQVGTRTTYNDRLLMFLLRNRAPKRFIEGQGTRPGAISKMKLKQLKKQWRKEWEEERQAASYASVTDIRASIARKVDDLRQTVLARLRGEWARLSPEAREALVTYTNLRARDLEQEVEIPDFLRHYKGDPPRENWWDVDESWLPPMMKGGRWG